MGRKGYVPPRAKGPQANNNQNAFAPPKRKNSELVKPMETRPKKYFKAEKEKKPKIDLFHTDSDSLKSKQVQSNHPQHQDPARVQLGTLETNTPQRVERTTSRKEMDETPTKNLFPSANFCGIPMFHVAVKCIKQIVRRSPAPGFACIFTIHGLIRPLTYPKVLVKDETGTLQCSFYSTGFEQLPKSKGFNDSTGKFLFIVRLCKSPSSGTAGVYLDYLRKTVDGEKEHHERALHEDHQLVLDQYRPIY
eukprot:m.151044 g.151044  ORF g.151044 m.151044 type:complete len:249 (+) comp15033_c0_seq9:1238-1984(+)